MKFVKMEVLIDKGGFSSSDIWKKIERQIIESIKSIVWPPRSNIFTIYPESGKKRGKGNGVKPIKIAFLKKLSEYGWLLEQKLEIATVEKPGKVDAVYEIEDKYYAIEWETGNISSSHRALNKMAIGLLDEKLLGGALIVPTRKMYNYLTDRVGNFRELSPYFPMWKALNIDEGFLVVIAVEHDAESWDVPRIEKGTNGRALI